MENKSFDYIEFKVDIISNELNFLEKYLLANIDKINDNSLTNLKEKIFILTNKLTKIQENYLVVKSKSVKDDEVKDDEVKDDEVKNESKPSINVLEYNHEMVNKVYQINYII